MKLNGWDIKEADARQWRVTPGFHSVSNDSEWSRGSSVPVLFRNHPGFKTLKITVLVKSDGGRQVILNRCSELLSHLLEPTEIELDGFEHKFFGILTKHTHNEKVMGRWHLLTLELNGYEFGAEISQTFSGATDFTVNNTGNIIAPAVVEITPQISAEEIVLTGFCRDFHTEKELPVTIRELTTGNKIVLDGETGLFTEGGRLKTGDIDIWEIPSVLPGNNKITVNNNRMDIKVRFRPRFM